MLDVNGEIVNAVMWVFDWTGLRYPGGDPSEIQRQAVAYEQQAKGLRETYDDMQAVMRGVDWSGPAAGARAGAWEEHRRLAESTAEGLSDTAKKLNGHATKADKIMRILVGIALEIFEQYVICLALSWVTAKLADVVFVTRVGALVTRLAQWWAEFRKLVISTFEGMKAWGSFAGKAGHYLGRIVADDVPVYVREYPVVLTATAGSQALGGRPINWGQVALWTVPAFAVDASLYRGIGILEDTTALGRFKTFVESGDALTTTGWRDAFRGEVPVPRPPTAKVDDVPPVLPEPVLSSGTTTAAPSRSPSEMSISEMLDEAFQLKPAQLNTLEDVVLMPLGQQADSVAEVAPQVWRYVPKTTGEAVYESVREGLVNGLVVLATGAMMGVRDGGTLAVDSMVSAPLSVLRKYVFLKASHGETWAYRNMPQSAPPLLRDLSAQIQTAMSYGMRDSVRSALWDLNHGREIPTQLGTGKQATAS